MAASLLSQACLVQSKLSFSPKILQSPRLIPHQHHCVSSPLAFLLKEQSGFVPKASLTAVTAQSNSNSSIPKKKFKNPVIVIDNYDSFTYNLCQYMGELGCDLEVYRNDEITLEDLKRMNPRGILISPGPGAPRDSGISLQTVLELGPTVPLFGVCMGLQCIGEAFGGKVVRAPGGVMHGKSSLIYYDEEEEDSLFSGLSNPFTAGRYHSLVVERESFPGDELQITAWTEDGLVMAARHKKYKHLQDAIGQVTGDD
ncbi:Anthranilate synthase beta subunit 1, chloroplastic [Morella rubra]|uniref:anthranilate synthase n=1 Tax=Morella rubra TaxID=262757 RepID=A0A6A1V032_9ROSI|nr:Anthranilate synthase beta subunit 1, chloroplastic [Morella rubra]